MPMGRWRLIALRDLTDAWNKVRSLSSFFVGVNMTLMSDVHCAGE